MAIVIKCDERREHEASVLQSFGVDPSRATAAQREAAEVIAARSNEVVRTGGRK